MVREQLASPALAAKEEAPRARAVDRVKEAARAEGRSKEAARPEARAKEAARDPASTLAWERLWLAIQRTSWMSIALVPIGPGIETPRLAAALAEIGRLHLGAKILVHDATKVSIATLQAALSELIDCEDRAIVALSPLTESPAGVELARAADAVVLCVALGESGIAEAKRILTDVGVEHVLGAVIVRKGEPSHE